MISKREYNKLKNAQQIIGALGGQQVFSKIFKINEKPVVVVGGYILKEKYVPCGFVIIAYSSDAPKDLVEKFREVGFKECKLEDTLIPIKLANLEKLCTKIELSDKDLEGHLNPISREEKAFEIGSFVNKYYQEAIGILYGYKYYSKGKG